MQKLQRSDIARVVMLHENELTGFLSKLGKRFLTLFYRTSLSIPEMCTFVKKVDGNIVGFVTVTTETNGLYKRIFFQRPIHFVWILLHHLLTHPFDIASFFSLLHYPGFSNTIPELLSLAVDRRFQRKGIGRELFEAGSEWFRRKNAQVFRISLYDRLPANGFYRAVGCRKERSFVFLGEKMNYYQYDARKRTNNK